MTEIIRLSEEQVKQFCEELLQDHPYLRDFEPDHRCCSCCVEDEVRERWGGDAARAWVALDEYGFLLGGSDG